MGRRITAAYQARRDRILAAVTAFGADGGTVNAIAAEFGDIECSCIGDPESEVRHRARPDRYCGGTRRRRANYGDIYPHLAALERDGIVAGDRKSGVAVMVWRRVDAPIDLSEIEELLR